jgi:hypothetical protein
MPFFSGTIDFNEFLQMMTAKMVRSRYFFQVPEIVVFVVMVHGRFVLFRVKKIQRKKF